MISYLFVKLTLYAKNRHEYLTSDENGAVLWLIKKLQFWLLVQTEV